MRRENIELRMFHETLLKFKRSQRRIWRLEIRKWKLEIRRIQRWKLEKWKWRIRQQWRRWIRSRRQVQRIDWRRLRVDWRIVSVRRSRLRMWKVDLIWIMSDISLCEEKSRFELELSGISFSLWIEELVIWIVSGISSSDELGCKTI